MRMAAAEQLDEVRSDRTAHYILTANRRKVSAHPLMVAFP